MSMLLGTRRALLGRRGLRPFDFDPAAIVFTPAMAIRAGSLFAGAPIIQGKLDGSGTPDVLSFSRGAQVHDNFYENFDPYQGTIVVTRLVPEWDGNDGLTHYLSGPFSANGLVLSKTSGDLLAGSMGAQNASLDASGWTAASSIAVAMRYDAVNDPDGANSICLSVDDAHTWGGAGAQVVAAPAATLYVGSAGTVFASNSIQEGHSHCRLPMWDGDYGVDLNGSGVDVMNVLQTGGLADAAKLIPAWHWTYFLPTDSTPGALPTTGQAWGWDYLSNVFGVDGWCAANYAASGWVTQGAPTAGPINFADTVDAIFGLQGYEWLCSAANEGPTYSWAGLTAGSNYLLVVDAHEEGVTTTGANLVLNPGFEVYAGAPDDGNSNTFTSWTNGSVNDPAGNKVEAVTVVTDPPHGGLAAVMITNTTGRPDTQQTFAGIVPGAHYSYSFWTHGDGAVAGQYKVRDVSNGADIIVITSTGVAGAAYAQVTVSFTAPRGCTTIYIRFFGSAAAGVVFFDDASVYLTSDDIRISIVDDTNGGLLTNFPDWDFGGGSGYVQMAEGVVTFRLPTNAVDGVGADCTAITIKGLSTIAAQKVLLHQMVLAENLWNDPSFEANIAITDVGTPTTSARDAGQAHSGGFSWKVITDAVDEGIKRTLTTTAGNYYTAVAWVYALTANTVDMQAPESHTGSAAEATTTVNDAWEMLTFCFRATAATTDLQFVSNAAVQTFYVDDVAVIEHRDVDLTVTPRNEANSTE